MTPVDQRRVDPAAGRDLDARRSPAGPPDMAEIPGIRRKASGRIVGLHALVDRPATVDETFDGDETPQRSPPTLFKRME